MTATGLPAAPGYNPRRTLPLRVEALRQLRRRRTMVAALILLALPWILVGAFELGGSSQPGPGAPGLVDLATTGGLNFAAFSFFASVGFLLVVAVALFCGDTVASEAQWASLRYLLAAPVPRARLLRQKLVVALAYSTVAVASFPLMSLVAGTVAFGWHPLRLPGTGAVLGQGAALDRMGIVLGYVLVTELVPAGLAFLLSVSTDSPLGAVGGAVGLVIVSDILDAVTAHTAGARCCPHWRVRLARRDAAADHLGRHARRVPSVSLCYAPGCRSPGRSATSTPRTSSPDRHAAKPARRR